MPEAETGGPALSRPGNPSLLRDRLGRAARYLRLSLTDRCNLHCLYCRSRIRHCFLPHPQVLRYEEMLRLVGVMAALGVTKLRLTGGEPFARRDCDRFLHTLRGRFPGLDLRLTSNGTLLEPHLPLLARIRPGAVNLSLDSFDRDTFARMTGRDLLPAVLAALDGLLCAGIPVKINAVALRGLNDGQVDDFVHAARTLPLDLRFIEYMPMGEVAGGPTGAGGFPGPENFWPAAEIRAEIERRARLVPEPELREEAGPARMYRVAGGRGRIGFISPISRPFCASCNRLRLTCDGRLRTCLFDDREYPLRDLLRNPECTDADLARAITQACLDKPFGADLLEKRPKGQAVAAKPMAAIGG